MANPNELRDEEGAHPVPEEDILGAVNAGIRLEGDSTQPIQDLHSQTATQDVPKRISEERRQNRPTERGERIQSPSTNEGPGGQEEWNSGKRQANLLHEDDAEKNQAAVTQQELRRL